MLVIESYLLIWSGIELVVVISFFFKPKLIFFAIFVVRVTLTKYAITILVLTLNLFKTTINSSCKNLYFSVYLLSAAYVDKCDQARKV